jgi:hypothetical protein
MNEQETSTNTEQVGQSSSAAQAIFGGGGEGGFEHGDTSSQDAGQQQQTSQQTQSAQPPSSASLTPEQLRELVSSTAREAVTAATTAARPQQQLSQDQINQMLNVFRVTPQHAQRLAKAMGLELQDPAVGELVSVLDELLEAKSRQAVTMSAVQLEALRRNELARINDQLSPVLGFAQQQQEAQMRSEFMQKYPDMQGWEPMLDMVYQQMVQEKLSYPTKEAAYKAAYDRAKVVLAKLPGAQGNGQQSGKQQQQQPQNGAGRRMSTVSTGGQMGAGGRQGNAPRVEKLARGLFGSS